jgi:hypothetical protein
MHKTNEMHFCSYVSVRSQSDVTLRTDVDERLRIATLQLHGPNLKLDPDKLLSDN